MYYSLVKTIKLALYGTPGAGKSTTTKIIMQYCMNENLICYRLRLADPLYECQKAVYEVAGKPLKDFYVQDGELLNFLGSHLRKINPAVLTEKFKEKLDTTEALIINKKEHFALIVCDDMRRPDYEFMKENGFNIINVFASPEVCISRREVRGDVSLGSHKHTTEQGLDSIIPDLTIENTGTLEELRDKVIDLLTKIL
jgi:cytidine deaminase